MEKAAPARRQKARPKAWLRRAAWKEVCATSKPRTNCARLERIGPGGLSRQTAITAVCKSRTARPTRMTRRNGDKGFLATRACLSRLPHESARRRLTQAVYTQ